MTDNTKFVNHEGLKEVLQGLKTYIDEKDTIRDTDTSVVATALETEVARAKQEERRIQLNLETEEEIRQLQIDAVNARVDTEATERENAINSNIALVTDAYRQHVAASRTESDALLAQAQTEIYGKILDEKIAINNALSNETARATSRETALENAITRNTTNHTQLNDVVTQHILDKTAADVTVGNPHGITTDKIGAATKAEHNELVNRVSQLENSSTDYGTAINEHADVIDTLVDQYEHTIRDVGENQRILGDLTIDKATTGASGSLHVTGDLIVDGTTTTIEHQTLSVKDHQLILNSDGEVLGNSRSGVVIRTDTANAYGIVYDSNNDSISLGKGAIADGKFAFETGEEKPLLTRDVSANIQDGHLLIWDAERKIAVDGGAYDLDILRKEFSTWEDNHKLAAEIQALSNKQVTDEVPLGRVTIVENTLTEEIKPQLSHHAEVIDELQTDVTTVTQNLDNHVNDTENPHGVTWTQIYQGTVNPFGNTTPKAIGVANVITATSGTSTQVSRADHVHPSDASRAPVEHTSTTNQYGQATDLLYGHVVVDSMMSDTSVNPVQNKVLKSYVDQLVQNLDVEAVTFEASETVKTIHEQDGSISTTKQAIAISQSQVEGLPDRLTKIETDVSAIDASLKETIDKVTGLDENLSDEITYRQQGDALVTQQVTEYVDSKIDNIMLAVTDDKMMLSNELTFTRDFGRHKVPASGSYTIGRKADNSLMSIRELLIDAFCDETTGQIIYPRAEFSRGTGVLEVNEGEVGASITPPSVVFKVTSLGSYQYGPAVEGVTYTATITSSTNETANDSNMTLDDTLVLSLQKYASQYTDIETTYTFQADFEHSAATVSPRTNMGNTRSSDKITGVTNIQERLNITYRGYRKYFMGAVNNTYNYQNTLDDTYDVATKIRALPKSGKYSAGTYEVTALPTDKQIVWAFPMTSTISPVFEYQLFGGWESLTGVVGPELIKVKGPNMSGEAMDYAVYVYKAPEGTFGASLTTRVEV